MNEDRPTPYATGDDPGADVVIARLTRERDEARAVLREARTWKADACDLISSAIPDASSWTDDGGLAERSDALEDAIARALG